jgi:hypothetical protein
MYIIHILNKKEEDLMLEELEDTPKYFEEFNPFQFQNLSNENEFNVESFFRDNI